MEDFKYKPIKISIIKEMIPFVKPFTFHIIGLVALMLGLALTDIAFPLIQAFAVDNFIVTQSSDGLVLYSTVYFGLILVTSLGVVGIARFGISLEMKIARDLKAALFKKLQTIPLSYYNRTSTGYILARVMSDTNSIGLMMAWGVIDIFWSGFYIIGVFVVMLILNWKLGLIALITIPLLVTLTLYFQKRIYYGRRNIRHINSNISAGFSDGIMGAATAKTLVIEDSSFDEFSATTERMKRVSLKTAKLNSIYLPIAMFIASTLVAVILARGGYMTLNEGMNIGVLSAFIAYAIGIFDPFLNLARSISDVTSILVNVERVSELLHEETAITSYEDVEKIYGDSFNPKTENFPDILGDVEFENVWFKYPDGDTYVLEDFSLKVKAGSTVAIVGETGAGKSTIVNLVCRFFEPTKGKILIDGVDYRRRSENWLHSNIGYVLQNSHLFTGSILDNIRYGNLDATDEQLKEAAQIVSADKVVARHKDGYDTDVGESGDMLSVGEKQLISFARAVAAKPKLFILDEATSSVDTGTERLIKEATNKLLEDTTSFVIAHRLSTINMADIILVVKNGKIIERGTHSELMAQNGYYYLLYTGLLEDEQ